MSSSSIQDFPEADRNDSKTLAKCAAIALLIEAAVLVGVGSWQHWLAHPQKNTSLDTSNFIETQMVQIPHENKLTEEKPVAAPARHEAVLSKTPDTGRKAKPEESKIDESNQTQARSSLGPTHGPVAVFSPSPVIPSYLQNKELHASVVIDFFVNSRGGTTPRLVGSSGNEELDALAIRTAQRWQFRPAEKDHRAVDSKVRLRILFEVH